MALVSEQSNFAKVLEDDIKHAWKKRQEKYNEAWTRRMEQILAKVLENPFFVKEE